MKKKVDKKSRRHIMAAVEKGIRIGKEIQDQFPEIGFEYLSKTLKQLVKKFRIMKRWCIGAKTAEMAVYNAVAGYDGHLECVSHKSYHGILEKRIFKAAGRLKRQRGCRNSGIAAWGRSDGVHGLTPKQRLLAVTKSQESRGYAPYSPRELAFIFGCVANAKYWETGYGAPCLKADDIARQANEKFHANESVRTKELIKSVISNIDTGKKHLITPFVQKKVKKAFKFRDRLQMAA